MSEFNPALVEESNKKAAQLNNERNRLMGQRESALQQFNLAVEAYKKKYGVALTSDKDLQAESVKVEQELIAAYNQQVQKIQYIESGQYKADALKRRQEEALRMAQEAAATAEAVEAEPEAAGQAVAPSVAPSTPFGAVPAPSGIETNTAPPMPFGSQAADEDVKKEEAVPVPAPAPVFSPAPAPVQSPNMGQTTLNLAPVPENKATGVINVQQSELPPHFSVGADADFGGFGGVPAFGDDVDPSDEVFEPEGWGLKDEDVGDATKDAAEEINTHFQKILGED